MPGDDITIGGGLDPVMAALIIHLYQTGLIDGPGINAIARRLPPDAAMAVRALVIEAAIDDGPDAMRAGMHLISGGNEKP